MNPFALLSALLLHFVNAQCASVTIAWTGNLRGRVFQHGRFGSECAVGLERVRNVVTEEPLQFACCEPTDSCWGSFARIASVISEVRAYDEEKEAHGC